VEEGRFETTRWGLSNEITTAIAAMSQVLFGRSGVLLLAAVVTALAGCATPDDASQPPRPQDGIAEYRQIVKDAHEAMGAALRSLDQVSAQTDRCPPKVLAAFSKDLERLEVESIQVRARSQAMLARGDAYFENWHENLARVENPKVRELAQQRRPEFQRSFANIKRNSDTTREAFKLFLSGLRRLQTTLEIDSASVGADATKDLIHVTKERGRQVEQGIAAVGDELKAMALMLTPPKATAKQ
jgi:hypothetical protein